MTTLILVMIIVIGTIYATYKYNKLEEKLLEEKVFNNSHPLRDFSDIKIGDKFEEYNYSSFNGGWCVSTYQLISLPDGKFQMVEIDENNKIVGKSYMAMKDSIEDVQVHLRANHYTRYV